MSRIDSLKEVKRGIGFTCRCGKSARITVRGQTLCYECFDEEMRYILDPAGHAERRMRERIRDIGRVALHRRRSTADPSSSVDGRVSQWESALPSLQSHEVF